LKSASVRILEKKEKNMPPGKASQGHRVTKKVLLEKKGRDFAGGKIASAKEEISRGGETQKGRTLHIKKRSLLRWLPMRAPPRRSRTKCGKGTERKGPQGRQKRRKKRDNPELQKKAELGEKEKKRRRRFQRRKE